jgi:hypothetical protein
VGLLVLPHSTPHKRKNRVSGFLLSIFRYLSPAACLFTLQLPSGAALVQAAPLLQQPASFSFSQQLAPRRSFNYQHLSPLVSGLRRAALSLTSGFHN